MIKALDSVEEGKRVSINCIRCDISLKKRLSSLGLFDGKEIEVLKNDLRGPVIVRVLDSKIVIGRSQAQGITVEDI